MKKKKLNVLYVILVTIILSVYVGILFVVSMKHIMSLNDCFDILKDNPDMTVSIINFNADSWATYLYVEKILGVVGLLIILLNAFFINMLLKAYKGITLNMLAGKVEKTDSGRIKELERKLKAIEEELDNAKNELITKELFIEELQLIRQEG